MADTNKTSPINVMGDTLDDFIKTYEKMKKDADKRIEVEIATFHNNLIEKGVKLEAEKQKKALEEVQNDIMELKARGIELSEKQMIEYAKSRQKQEESANKKAQIAYWNTQSKKAQELRKKEQKEQDRELKIAKLRSTTDENGNKKSLIERTSQSLLAGALETFTNATKKLGENLGKLTNAVSNAMSQYAQYQAGVNARLQGTSKTWSNIESSLEKVSFSPLLKADKLYENLATLVNEGIVSNVEQRAFLMTIKDNIATTFDVNNTSLKRIIRIQQEDTTASRLGLEAYLTTFMNQMVENTEYLTTSFDNVQSALLEASSLMTAKASTEFEYIVQKWLGTLTGVGLSESASSSIAQALGYLGSGNIESLNSSNLQNLLVMASSRAGLDFGQMLKEGLDSSTTNQLLESLVTFVQSIYNDSKDNKLVMSQFANTFGLTVSDVKAIANIQPSALRAISNSMMSYSDMYSELGYQFNQITSRMSVSTMLDNLFSNFTYSTGADLASNPATYATWKIADFITSTTGGINIPHATVLGTGVDMNATVEQLIKLGLVGISTLGNIGNIVKGVSSVGSGSKLLDLMGINMNSATIQSRGTSLSTRNRGVTTSQSSVTSPTGGQTYYQNAMAGVNEEKTSQIKASEQEDNPVKDIRTLLNDNIPVIVEHLKEVLK